MVDEKDENPDRPPGASATAERLRSASLENVGGWSAVMRVQNVGGLSTVLGAQNVGALSAVMRAQNVGALSAVRVAQQSLAASAGLRVAQQALVGVFAIERLHRQVGPGFASAFAARQAEVYRQYQAVERTAATPLPHIDVDGNRLLS